jgi:uncharacterized protein (DUF885 family)
MYTLCALCVNNVYATVPTIDINQASQDVVAMSSYTTEILTKLNKLGQAADIAVQISELKSLQDVEKVGGEICKLCSNSDQLALQKYINQVNDDLCSQFSFAMKSIIGAQKTVKSIEDIINAFKTNPKEAGLALQSATVKAQFAIQGSLAQIQVLLAQTAQKQLAEQKLEKQNNQAVYSGIKQNGL